MTIMGSAPAARAHGRYGAVWLIGDAQAIRLRPTWIDGRDVCMRLGLRWAMTVPRSQVCVVRKLGRGESVADALRLALPNAPRVLVEFATPVTALGVYGVPRTVRAVELGVDDPDGFVARLGGMGQ